MIIRPTTADDVPEITEIYTYHVLHGTATFEIDPPSVEEMGVRRAAIVDCRLPYMVAVLDGIIAAYAYAAPYRPRPAYRFTVEDSIYVRPGYAGRGVGKQLLTQIIREAEAAGMAQMIAVIGDSANIASIKLHRSLGFQDTGVLRNVGFKFNRWLDTVLMQRALGESHHVA